MVECGRRTRSMPAPQVLEGARLTGHIRKRVNHLLHADRRFTYGQ